MYFQNSRLPLCSSWPYSFTYVHTCDAPDFSDDRELLSVRFACMSRIDAIPTSFGFVTMLAVILHALPTPT